MRYRAFLLLIILMLVAPGLLAGQAEKAPPPAAPDTRAADLLAELSKLSYTAKRAIPASDNIFVENGRVVEALFVGAKQDHDMAIAADQTAAVSKVLLLDKALHVFFADGKCALLIILKQDQSMADMTPPQLLELARKGIGALFVIKEVSKPVT